MNSHRALRHFHLRRSPDAYIGAYVPICRLPRTAVWQGRWVWASPALNHCGLAPHPIMSADSSGMSSMAWYKGLNSGVHLNC